MKSLFIILFSISLQTCISNTYPVDNPEAIWTPSKINQEKSVFANR